MQQRLELAGIYAAKPDARHNPDKLTPDHMWDTPPNSRAVPDMDDDKNYAAVDGLGNPVRLLLTGGEVADITQAQALIDGFEAIAIVADKGYDSDVFVISITARNVEAVIPSRKNRIIAR